MTHTPLPQSIDQLNPGDHLCCIYETEEQRRTLLTPFLRQGLEHGEKVLYLIDESSREDILDYLGTTGIKEERYLERGQLEFLAAEEVCIRRGTFDPDSMMALLEREIEKAVDEGWEGLRLTGEMSWAVQGLPGSERLIEYEAKLNRFLDQRRCISLCQYDRRRFDSRVLLDVLRTHPAVVVGTEIYENFHYVSPEALLDEAPFEGELERWIQSLVERTESEARYRTFINSTSDMVFLKDEGFRHIVANKALADFFGRPPEAVIGLSDFELIPPEAATDCQASDKRALETGSVVVTEEVMGDRVFETTKFPASLPSGRTGVGGFIRDITERKRIEGEIKRRNEELAALNAIGAMVNQSLDLDRVLNAALRETLAVLGVEAGLIYLSDQTGRTFSPVSHHGISPDLLHDLSRLEIGEGLAGHVAKSGDPLVISLDRDSRNLSRTSIREGFRSYAGVPIRFKDKVLGVMSLITCQEEYFKPEHLTLLGSIGNQVGVAIENAYLYEQARREIAERDQAEKALRESEEKYRLLVENAGEAILVVQDHMLKFANTKLFEMTGFTNDELVSEPLSEFIHPADREMVLGRHEKRRQGMDVPPRYSFRVLSKSGDVRWVELNVAMIEWEGRPAALGFLSDITERKQAEEALRESQEYQQAMIATSPLAIFSLDPDGRVRSWNVAAERSFGWSEQEVLGEFLPIVPEDQLDAFAALRMRVLEGETLHRLELTRRRKDGSPVEVSVSAAPIRDNKGRIEAIMAVLEDISDRKRAEEEREKLEAQLRQSQKMEAVGRLAGGVAHDFNNMLSVIIGHAELAMTKVDPDSPLQEDLQQVHNAGQRSTAIIRQLLAFARKQIISPQVLDLNETVEGMLKMLRRLIGEDIELSWRPGANLWPVRMDPSQLDQILANLCVNARDAIDGVGKITIETGTVTFDEAYCAAHHGFVPGDFVLLAVTDNGCGMDKDTLDNVFEPFFTTKGTDKGTGLGLATVYGIVKQNNGFINAYSEPGLGTTIRIYLPRHEGDSTKEIQKEESEETPSGQGETVLIVEDETPVLKLSQRLLQKLGYKVLTATTPSEAIRLAERHPGSIDLLMTDVVMPEMNGRDLAEMLHADHPAMKTLFMSGYTANVISYQGVLAEGVCFLEKPFSMTDIAAKVREALSAE